MKWRDPRLPKRWTDVRPEMATLIPLNRLNRLLTTLDRMERRARGVNQAIEDRLAAIEAERGKGGPR
jgi:hypothetical protein